MATTFGATRRPRLSPRTGEQCTVLEENLSTQQVEALFTALEQADAFLGPDSLLPLDEVVDFEAATQALHRGWSVIRTAVAAGPAGSAGTATAERVGCGTLEELMVSMVENERVVRTAQVEHRRSAVRMVSEVLADLRDVATLPRLIEAGAEAVCRIGFDRAIVSRVEDSTWLTEAIEVDGDSEWAAEILAVGRSQPQTLNPTLPELELVRRRRPILVTGVQQKETVHQAVASASQSRSYVAAPLAPSNRVLGFLHADRFFHRGDVTTFDAELLGMFAQGYSYALECALVREELEELRRRVSAIGDDLRASSRPTHDPVAGRVSWKRPVEQATASTPAPSPATGFGTTRGTGTPAYAALPPDSELTRRELDVFRLMAQGETNHRIANRLAISEGTVKSHVKHILRKLGAANRAEAVAVWHRSRAV